MLLDLLAPTLCAGCGDRAEAELCEACAHRIVAIVPACDRCGDPGRCRCERLEGFVRARSLVAFAEPARRLTLELKRRGPRRLANDMGALLADLARGSGLAADVITYVPAGRRADGKGFDGAALLAKGVGRALDVPVKPVVKRVGDGPRQADVPLAERRANVAGRFAAGRAEGSVLLVDDVYTTGATAEACSVALVRAGASAVNVLTWARTIRRLYSFR